MAQLEPENQGFYKDLRTSLAEILAKKPKLEWMGLTWHWCEVTKPEAGGMLIAAHLIPDPTNPRIAITLSTAFFKSNPPAKLPKFLHNNLNNATAIGHQAWCEWPISSQDGVDAIVELITISQGE